MTDFTPDGNELYETIPSPPSTIGRPPKYETPDLLFEKCRQYFEDCKPEPVTIEGEDGEIVAVTDKSGKPVMIEKKPTTYGLALYLGYASPQSLYDLKHKDDGFSYVITSAMSMIGGEHEANLFTNANGGS